MNIKKVGKKLISGLVAGMILLSSSGVYAADALRLGATLWRENTEKKNDAEASLIAYKSDYVNDEQALEELRVWKLVEQNGDATTMNYEKAIYCLKAGIGFTGMLDANTYTEDGVDYNKKYNMYDKEQIKTAMGWDDTTYNKVLWIIDNMYVQNVSTTTMDELLKSVEYTDSDEVTKSIYDRMNESTTTEEDLTKNDIEVIQQMAIWYFTNSEDPKYHDADFSTLMLNFRSEISDTNVNEDFKSMADLYDVQIPAKPYGTLRQEYASELYKYLISQAEANAQSYTHVDDGTTATFWTNVNEDGNITTGTDARQPVVIIEKPEFDLALRKYITKVYEDEEDLAGNTQYRHQSTQANPSMGSLIVDTSKLNTIDETTGKLITTATYRHRKQPIEVQTGNIVEYNLTVYNEGNIAGRATEIVDQLPTGLEFYKLGADTASNYKYVYNENTNVLTITEKGEVTHTNLNPFSGVQGDELDSKTITVLCKVVAEVEEADKVLTNIAWINEAIAQNNVNLEDRDSQPTNHPEEEQTDLPTYKGNEENKTELSDDDYFYQGEQDDDDFEKIILKGGELDLALRKFITAVNDTELVEEDGKYLREPKVDTANLNKIVNGVKVTTADYNHTKMPLTVQVGDVVTYTIRVYNEGDINGYVSKITDHLPKWLEFIGDNDTDDEEAGDFNVSYLWTYDPDTRKVTTDVTKKDSATGLDSFYKTRENGKLLTAWDGAEDELDYIDVKIKCRVIDTVGEDKLLDGTRITNIAEISEKTDENGNIIEEDRDARPGNLLRPTEEAWPEYKGSTSNKSDLTDDNYFYKGQQDDDDFEKVVVQVFDMALRKFITDVDGSPVNNRYPVPTFDESLNRLVYNHPKTPVEVVYGDIVTYTIRVYNEGTIDGYVEEITDDLPEYLTFLPDHEINKEYAWVMRDEFGVETDNLEDAVCITTDYLSKENGEPDEGSTLTDEAGNVIPAENSNLIKAFDKDATVDELNPDYREVKVAMRVDLQVTSDNLEDAKRILINEAQISEDADKEGLPVEDIDSDPERDDKYNYEGDNEDDIDYEPVKVKYFDLALKKWVTQSIVTENGKTTTTNSGHTGDEYPEPPMKVELKSKYLKTSTVKFRFKIKVTNQGEIAGYATELTDHIPQGLEFVQADNPGWYERGDGLVATDALKNTLLQPGESATVEIVLTWIRGNNNFGLKTNYAEISQDDNANNIPDIDSDPDNFTGKIIEDDEDEAPVVLSIKTGQMPMYFALTATIIAILAGGVILIKKYVI